MASLLTSTCWPRRFIERWLAVFFAAVVLGGLWGATAHKPPKPLAPKQAPPLKNVRVSLEAYEVYTDGTKDLIPAHVTTGGRGDKPVEESNQGATSTDLKKPLLISREPGTKQWLIFKWQGATINRRIDPWPKSSIPYIVEFNLHHPNPHTVKHRAAH